MKPFTYDDYLYYIKIFCYKGNNACLKDNNEKYKLIKSNNKYTNTKVLYPHDKMFKDVLDDKKEVVEFLNEILKLENTPNELHVEEIEKYNRKFVSVDYTNQESDVIYKLKNKEIFTKKSKKINFLCRQTLKNVV